jgi:two-component system CheB/CheR fusion protein
VIKVLDLPAIEAIPLQMHQLFHNIIGNALKFTRDDVSPRIRISSCPLSRRKVKEKKLRDDVDYCEIIISDNGIGFKNDFAENIFKIFSRLNDKHKFEGTGIGLALSKKIVNVHKGHIFAVSEEGKGTSIHVILPVEQPR